MDYLAAAVRQSEEYEEMVDEAEAERRSTLTDEDDE